MSKADDANQHQGHRAWFLLAVLVVLLAGPCACAGDASLLFERDVKPLLAKHCFACHGEEKLRANLDLRTVTGMLRGGDTGPAIVRGEPSASLLLDLVGRNEMPPKKRQKLSATEVALLRRWVEQGAPAREKATAPALVSDRDRAHWAFRKLARPALPAVKDVERVRTPVDAFVLARLEAKGLGLSPDAERPALLRRLSFDLTGLPPSPEELEAFLADRLPSAYERAVDRLLSSPHFGERWGRHWLDGAGYVDVTGTDNDAGIVKLGPGKWLYRDHVVRAFNQDQPFDRFLVEQLAGDELVDWRSTRTLTPTTRKLLVATGFLRVAADDTDENELNTLDIRHRVLQQTGEIVASNLLGLTLQCARCHNHKYDPLPQRDYYRVLAILSPAFNPANWSQPTQRQLADVSPGEKAAIDAHNADLDRRLKDRKKRDAELRKIAKPSAAQTRELSEIAREVAELNKQRRTYGAIQAVYDVGPPSPTRVLLRGEYDRPTYAVEPGLPAVLAETDDEAVLRPGQRGAATSGRRLELARRLTTPNTRAAALVARVRVNRIWQQLFGRGLVPTSDNFGRSGTPPTHPELLDWLAGRFVADGWRTKSLVRLLVTSTVYRQASGRPTRPGAGPGKIDPDNALLWRMRLRRLESEGVRDAMLTVSGRLDRSLGGPPVPHQNRPDGLVTVDSRRRSLYILARRNYHPTLLGVFDQPVIATNCTARSPSAVVTQSLAMLNDAFILEQAAHFADRVAREAGPSTKERVERAFLLSLSRKPSGGESEQCVLFLNRQATRFRAEKLSGEQADRQALAQLCQTLLNTSEFLYLE
jgi:hypothetical protein